MTRRIVPDSMAAYATHELSQALLRLTPDQRSAIGRIVKHHYLDNKPLGHLFEGDAPICSENTYYKKGFFDEATQTWRKVGWSHQPEFVAALELATRLALAAEQGEDLHKLRKARRRAIDEAENAVDVWVGVMADKEQPAKDRNDAAARVLNLAFEAEKAADDQPAAGAAGDWWGAALDD